MTESSDKIEVVRGIRYAYSSEWITSLESEEHWRLYWRQQKIMQGLVHPGQEVLEIGVGSGFTANYLRSKAVSVTTIDIDPDKKPDIVANIVSYDFPDRYDHILAFEVFEHIPYTEFETVLQKLAGACRSHLFISVPRNESTFLEFHFRLPKIGRRSFNVVRKKGRITEKRHFWEIGYGETSEENLESTFQIAGFSVVNKDQAFFRQFYALQLLT